MGSLERTREDPEQEIRELRAQLAESQETLRAIREGEVDALVVSTPEGQRIFTLQSADQTYRTIIEQMQEGAVTYLNMKGKHRNKLKRELQFPLKEYFIEIDVYFTYLFPFRLKPERKPFRSMGFNREDKSREFYPRTHH